MAVPTALRIDGEVGLARVGEHCRPNAIAKIDDAGKVLAIGPDQLAHMHRYVAPPRQPLAVAQD